MTTTTAAKERPPKRRRVNMAAAGKWIEAAVAELQPAVASSCPNELAMRVMMALIRINLAFEEAGMYPMALIVPCENVQDGSPGSMELRSPFGQRMDVGEQYLMFPTDAGELKQRLNATYPRAV